MLPNQGQFRSNPEFGKQFCQEIVSNINTFMKVAKIKRKKTRQIKVGKVKIGGSAPIAVQSMTNTPTQDIAATVSQIKRLQEAGCEIVRVAVPDQEAAAAIAAIKAQIDIPLIADIHFNYRLAIAAAKSGADGLRLKSRQYWRHAKGKGGG